MAHYGGARALRDARWRFRRLLRERVRLTNFSATKTMASSGVGWGKGTAARSKVRILAIESAGSTSTANCGAREGARVYSWLHSHSIWATNRSAELTTNVNHHPKWATHVRAMWATHMRVECAKIIESTVLRETSRPCFANCSDRVRRSGPPVSALRNPLSECGVRIRTRSQRARLAQCRVPPFFAAVGDNCCREWSTCGCDGSDGPGRRWPGGHR
jgi:hypothetical protein